LYSGLVVSTSASDWLERLSLKKTCNVMMGTSNPAHSLIALILSAYVYPCDFLPLCLLFVSCFGNELEQYSASKIKYFSRLSVYKQYYW